ncbi:MAG: hypothetical protein PUP91_16795 [Rhizonema sp. PD37]|nr:hypothetical protein [Rhizonema sp. PD37]
MRGIQNANGVSNQPTQATLQLGSTGNVVKELQKILKDNAVTSQTNST